MYTKPIRGTLLNKLHPLSKGLIGLWIFNEGSGNKVYDLTGNGNHGTFGAGAAAPTWMPGRNGPALNFDGGDYVATTEDDQFAGQSISIATWINIKTINEVDEMYVVARIKSSTQKNFHLIINTDGTIQFGPYSACNGATTDPVTSAALTTAKWYHIVATLEDSVQKKLYIDGKNVDTVTTGALSIPSGCGNMQTVIGARQRVAIRPFNGIIDEVLIYNRALSAAEIWQLYVDPYYMFAPIDDIAALYIAVGQEYTESVIIKLQSKYNQLSAEEYQLLKILQTLDKKEI